METSPTSFASRFFVSPTVFPSQAERGEWLQFQADLQVAVSVADRLRAEADEELTALRVAHRDVERELAAAQQRQKEADEQLVGLRAELKESRQRLAALAQGPGGEPVSGPGGRERPPGSAERQKNVEKVGIECRDVAKRYLRNVSKEEESRSSEPQRSATTERSR